MWKCVNATATTLLAWFFLESAKKGFGPQTIPLKFALQNGETSFIFISVHYWEYFLVAAIGIAAGLIGCAFVEINIRLTKLRRRLNFSKPLQLLEVIFFTVLSKWNVLVTFHHPMND